MASGVTPGGGGGISSDSAAAEETIKAFASAPAEPPPPPADAFASLSTSSSSSSNPSSPSLSGHLAPGEIVRDNGDALPAIVVGDDGAGQESGGDGGCESDEGFDHSGGHIELTLASATPGGSSGVQQPQQQPRPRQKNRLKLSNRSFPSKEFLTSKALGSFQSSPATRYVTPC